MNTYNDCWQYAGNITSSGYGSIKGELVHRLMWQAHNGDIPLGLVVDHLCRNRECVNPEHLEPVTIGENTRRGLSPNGVNSHKAVCVSGHEFNKENTIHYSYNGINKRKCRVCRKYFNRIHQREFRAKRKLAL